MALLEDPLAQYGKAGASAERHPAGSAGLGTRRNPRPPHLARMAVVRGDLRHVRVALWIRSGALCDAMARGRYLLGRKPVFQIGGNATPRSGRGGRVRASAD